MQPVPSRSAAALNYPSVPSRRAQSRLSPTIKPIYSHYALKAGVVQPFSFRIFKMLFLTGTPNLTFNIDDGCTDFREGFK